MVTTIAVTNLSVPGNRMNLIMKEVTSSAAIIAVPTAITGWYGRNLPFPGFEKRSGPITTSALILVLAVGFSFCSAAKEQPIAAQVGPASARNLAEQLPSEPDVFDLFSHVGEFDHLVFTAGEALAFKLPGETALEEARQQYEIRLGSPRLVPVIHLGIGPRSLRFGDQVHR